MAGRQIVTQIAAQAQAYDVGVAHWLDHIRDSVMVMETQADAVVIGGGIFGASVGHFLAKLGFGKIVLLEQRRFAAVSTGHTGGAVRTAYTNPLTIRLAKRAVEMFGDGERWLGGDCGFRRNGYLVLADAAALGPGRKMMQLELEQAIAVEELSVEEIHARWPEIDLKSQQIAGGIFEPDSGIADGALSTRSLIDSAAAWGLTAYEGVGAKGIERRGDKVSAVATDQGVIQTPVVVNAAGGWGGRAGQWVGRNYSLRWSRESDIVVNVPIDTDHLPWISDPQLRFYARPHGPQQILAGLGFPKELEPLDIDRYDEDLDDATHDRIAGKLHERLPITQQGSFDHGWASMYTITDDWHPLVGPEESVPGYYAFFAGNGHCFKLAPPMGESLAQTIAGQTPTIDLHPLRPGRFKDGEYFTSAWGSGNRA